MDIFYPVHGNMANWPRGWTLCSQQIHLGRMPIYEYFSIGIVRTPPRIWYCPNTSANMIPEYYPFLCKCTLLNVTYSATVYDYFGNIQCSPFPLPFNFIGFKLTIFLSF